MYGQIAAIGVGAGLMYLLDPDKGPQRRSQLSDQACQMTQIAQETMERATEAIEKTTNGTRNGFSNLAGSVSSWGRKIGFLPEQKKSFLPINSPMSRVLTGATGAALALYGLRRWSKTGAGLATVGISLLASGITGRDLITR